MAHLGEVRKLRVELKDRMKKKLVRMGAKSRISIDANFGGTEG